MMRGTYLVLKTLLTIMERVMLKAIVETISLQSKNQLNRLVVRKQGR